MATYDLTSSIPSSSSLKTGDILNCPYSGTYKSITLPKGTYKLECWGAQGGTGNPTANIGGLGGYSYGNITLAENTVLFLYTGSKGYDRVETTVFNGGGIAEGSSNYNSGSGGGASDIRIKTDSLYARVIVAGGGGGGAGANETTYIGGYGGGTLGGSSSANSSGSSGTASGGNQTGAGTFSNPGSYTGLTGSFGQGGNYSGGGDRSGGGGGGGWYGGGAGSYGVAGAGGSGYVYTSSTASNYPSGCLLNSNYYLTSASTIAGNSSFISPTGSSETGHGGNGYIRITIQSIANWAYSTVSISAPTYNKQNTSSWTLSPSTCRYFSFTPTISGDFIVYSNSSIDTYGYLTSNITSLNSSGQPSSNILVSDDDYAKKYGGTGANFGICYKVTAGTTYYIYVKPYRDSTANSSVYLTYYMAHPDSRVYVKINSTTWKLITN